MTILVEKVMTKWIEKKEKLSTNPKTDDFRNKKNTFDLLLLIITTWQNNLKQISDNDQKKSNTSICKYQQIYFYCERRWFWLRKVISKRSRIFREIFHFSIIFFVCGKWLWVSDEFMTQKGVSRNQMYLFEVFLSQAKKAYIEFF